MSDKSLTELQDDLRQRLESDPFFAQITILTEDKEDIVAELNQELATLTTKAGGTGVAVVVLSPNASDPNPDLPFGPMEMAVDLLVVENVLINDTGVKALEIARHVVKLMKLFTAGGRFSTLVPRNPVIAPLRDLEPLVAYNVQFACREADDTIDQKVATPTISPAGGAVPQTVTLSTATGGATIYYTLDGTYPYSGNPAAVAYSAPFNVNTPATLRVAAYASGYVPSNVAAATFV